MGTAILQQYGATPATQEPAGPALAAHERAYDAKRRPLGEQQNDAHHERYQVMHRIVWSGSPITRQELAGSITYYAYLDLG